jgi:hypothetical protein
LRTHQVVSDGGAPGAAGVIAAGASAGVAGAGAGAHAGGGPGCVQVMLVAALVMLGSWILVLVCWRASGPCRGASDAGVGCWWRWFWRADCSIFVD